MAVTLQDPAPGLVSVADGFHRLEFKAMGTVCKIDFAHASRARAEGKTPCAIPDEHLVAQFVRNRDEDAWIQPR